MLSKLSLPNKLRLLTGAPLAPAGALALLVSSGASQALTLITAGCVGASALLCAWLGKDARRAFSEATTELENLRQEKAQQLAKRSRGRRDAFNEVLLGLEERANEVQRDRDNLESLVEQRTLALQQRNEAMRLVLDNVEQGLATIELDGELSPERSRAFDLWFSSSGPDQGFESRLAAHDPDLRAELRLAWSQLVEGFLPLELTLEQMPKRLDVNGKHYTLHYRPIQKAEQLDGVLLMVTDVSDQIEGMQREVQQREIINVFERLMRDRNGFIVFFEECSALVERILQPTLDRPQLMRAIHTLKGNCAVFGVTSVVTVAHEIESAVAERDEAPTRSEIEQLQSAWRSLADRVRSLVERVEEPSVDVSPAELQALQQAIAGQVSHAELARLVERLTQERVVLQLQRSAEQARALAQRLGKPNLEAEVRASEQLRFSAPTWAGFWGAFVHIVRNAVDHGIEPPEERLACGKPAAGKLRFSATCTAETFTVELSDDGRGIDWERVRDRAAQHGLPHEDPSDLVAVLFADGVSTAEKVSDISGRGVGMGAVREATLALGGSVVVASTRGQGTTIRFVFPLASTAPCVGPASTRTQNAA